MERGEEQGRIGRLWVRAFRAAQDGEWRTAEYAAVELAVGPVGLADRIAEAMLVALCRSAWRQGWTHEGLRQHAAEVRGPAVSRLVDLALRVEQSRVRAGPETRVRSGWLARWRASCGLGLTEGYVVVVQAHHLITLSPPVDDLIA